MSRDCCTAWRMAHGDRGIWGVQRLSKADAFASSATLTAAGNGRRLGVLTEKKKGYSPGRKKARLVTTNIVPSLCGPL